MENKGHGGVDAANASSEKLRQEEDHVQQALDEALRESFPASDPVAVNIDSPAPAHAPGKAKP